MKNRIKISVDCVMLIALLLLMAYSLIGEEAHEWVGLIFLTMFVIHQVLNLYWWTHLRTCFHGTVRSIHSAVNFLLLADVLFLGGSGIIMSRYLFRFLQIDRGMETARNIHMFCSYWGFLLMSVHLGLHWNILFYRIKRIVPMWDKAKFIRISFRTVAGLIAVYGGYAFGKSSAEEIASWKEKEGRLESMAEERYRSFSSGYDFKELRIAFKSQRAAHAAGKSLLKHSH